MKKHSTNIGFSGYRDLEGKPVDRNIWEYPYSFDPFVTWIGDYKKSDRVIYSDRIHSWYPETYNEVKEQHAISKYGSDLEMVPPEILQDFLNTLMTDLTYILKLTAVMKCCNRSNGYPYYAIYFESLPKS